MKSSSEASKSSAFRIWSKYATCKLAPRRMLPLSASSSPKIIFRSVVLPAPLGPNKPILSPRSSVAVKSLAITL